MSGRVLPQVSAPARCRVGVDLMAVEEVMASVERLGHRYLDRVYTPAEVASCKGAAMAAGLAARFAAKEAVIKVLRPAGAQPEWRSIEVVRRASGACDVALWGTAAEMAARAGLGPMSLSMTHEAGLAAAVVVAQEVGGQEDDEKEEYRRHGNR